jgi:hypothetical protein
MKRVPKIILSSVLAGILLLVVSAAFTNTPWAGPTGFPLAYKVANPPTCGTINPLNGCGYSQDFVSLGVDYLLWFSTSLALLSIGQLTWSKLTPGTRKDTASPTPQGPPNRKP